jgi:hypothetical protein
VGFSRLRPGFALQLRKLLLGTVLGRRVDKSYNLLIYNHIYGGEHRRLLRAVPN